MNRRLLVRNVIFALLGVAVLILKPVYHGPLEDVVYSYAGNASVSFALYFAGINTAMRYRWPRLIAVLATLVVVEAFELTDGLFGAMDNVFDPFDLLANAVGICLAVLVDVATTRLLPLGSIKTECDRRSQDERL